MLNVQSVPRSKHSVSVIQTSQLMLYREIIAVCSQIHTKHINTLCGQNAKIVNVKPGDTYSNHYVLRKLLISSLLSQTLSFRHLAPCIMLSALHKFGALFHFAITARYTVTGRSADLGLHSNTTTYVTESRLVSYGQPSNGSDFSKQLHPLS